MSCDKYFDLMSAALDGELTAEERQELDSHLANCAHCADLFDELCSQSSALRSLDCGLPDDLHDRILNGLPPQAVPTHKSKVIHWRRWGSLAACLVVALGVGAYARFGLRMGAGAPLAANEIAAPGSAVSQSSAPTALEDIDDSSRQSAQDTDQIDGLSAGEFLETDVSAESKLSQGLPAGVQYLQVSASNVLGAPHATVSTVLNSADSLALYLADGVSFDGQNALIEAYTEEFFADHSLIAVLIGEPSGLIRHKVLSVSPDAVTIRQTGGGSADEATWLILVEVDEVLSSGSSPSVELVSGESAPTVTVEENGDPGFGLKGQGEGGIELPGSFSLQAPANVQYIRVGYGATPQAPSALVIASADSLAAYLAGYGTNHFDEEGNPVPLAALEALKETYTDEFFANHCLVAVLLEEGSGSVRHELLSVDGQTVTIRRIVPEVGTCDMAAWLIVAELDTMLDDGSVLSINFAK